MSKSVKTTKIEKKYTDKQGNEKTLTIDYAKVVDRLNEFRRENTRGKVETSFVIKDGQIAFKAYILKDKADEFSAEATGHAVEAQNSKTDKQFEKLETIAVGRALALLGYSAGGEIASQEEMEEFNQWKLDRIQDAVDGMKSAQSLDELKSRYFDLGELKVNAQVIKAKDARKEELQNANN